jgi:hypothetical protein
MFPHIATEYYAKRAVHVREREEQRLREMIMRAIPTGGNGWKDDFPQPKIIIKQPELMTPELQPTAIGELTPPPTPLLTPVASDNGISHETSSPSCTAPAHPWDVPLYLDPLPRAPPLTCSPHPPPTNMSLEAKLLCLARWTFFNPSTGTPYLPTTPRNKDSEMHWTDAVYAGATDAILVAWAKEMWWSIWIRQSNVNYTGMWKERFNKEDKKAEKARLEEEVQAKAEELVKKDREKIMRRLKMLNEVLGVADGEVAVV